MKTNTFNTIKKFAVPCIASLALSACATTSEALIQHKDKAMPTHTPQATTFVMIHSAWMGGWSFQHVGNALAKQGYRYQAPDLPAHGSDKTPVSEVSLASYVDRITETIDKIDGSIILVGHSFGGVVASQVAEERPEKVKGIHYLCAFMLPSGASFLDATQHVKDSKVLNNLFFTDNKQLVGIKEEALHEAVAHDVPEAAFLAAKPHLVLEPTKPLGEKVHLTSERYGQVPRFYTQCSEDSAIPPSAQAAMLAQQPVEKVYTLNASHAPIFSMPNNVANVLVDSARYLHTQ